MSGLAKVDESADEEVPAPASEPAKASNAGNAVAMDDVVDTLAEAAAKAMLGDMAASEKEEMTQAMAQAVKDAAPQGYGRGRNTANHRTSQAKIRAVPGPRPIPCKKAVRQPVIAYPTAPSL